MGAITNTCLLLTLSSTTTSRETKHCFGFLIFWAFSLNWGYSITLLFHFPSIRNRKPTFGFLWFIVKLYRWIQGLLLRKVLLGILLVLLLQRKLLTWSHICLQSGKLHSLDFEILPKFNDRCWCWSLMPQIHTELNVLFRISTSRLRKSLPAEWSVSRCLLFTIMLGNNDLRLLSQQTSCQGL